MRQSRPAPIILIAIVLLGLVLCFAGWRDAYDGFHIDDIGNRNNARALVEHGELPVTSGLSGLGGYNPAGSSWYFVPSVFFDDIRVGERFAAFLLYLLTIIPLYLVCDRIADRTTALIVAFIYTISAVGIFFEHSLWYRARPFSYAWLAYFAIRWFESGEKWFLFGVVVSLGLGLLIHLEMAPIVIGLAFAWWKFRPRIRWSALALGAAFVILAWTPFLRLQMQRDFVDLSSVLLMSRIGLDRLETLESYGDEIRTWSFEDNKLVPFTPTRTQARHDRSLAKKALIRAFYVGQMALSNFRRNHLLGLIPVMLVLIFGLAIANHLYAFPETDTWRKIITGGGFLIIALAIAFNQFSIGSIIARPLGPDERTLLQLVQSAAVAFGVALILRKSIRSIAFEITRNRGFGGTARPLPKGLRILAAIVLPTWAVFVVLAHFERFLLGFWVLQLLLVATCLIHLPRHLGMSRRTRAASVLLAVLLVIPNSDLSNVVRSSLDDGYAGKESDIILVLDAVAKRSRERGLADPRVGYFSYFGNGYELTWGLQDARFGGFGSALHQYLRLQHGLSGSQPPPEGFSAYDDFRIVQTRPEQAIFPHRFVMDDVRRYRPIGQIGLYEILERVPRNDI